MNTLLRALVAMAVLSSTPAPQTVQEATLALLMENAGPHSVDILANRFEPDQAVGAIADALEHNPAFVENTRARQLAFDALVRIGETNQSGRLVYRDPVQARVLLKGLHDRDPAALTIVVRRAYLLDPKYYAEATDALTRLLRMSVQPGTIQDAAFSLAQIGDAARPALPALKQLLVEPEKANPECWHKITVLTPEILEHTPMGWRDEFIATWDERSAQAQVDFLTSVGAARGHIAPEDLASDIDIYPRSPLLRRVGVAVLWSLSLADSRAKAATLFDADEATQQKAARLVSEFIAQTDNADERDRALLLIERVMRAEDVAATVKSLWRTEALHAADNVRSVEARHLLLTAVSSQ